MLPEHLVSKSRFCVARGFLPPIIFAADEDEEVTWLSWWLQSSRPSRLLDPGTPRSFSTARTSRTYRGRAVLMSLRTVSGS